MSEKDEVTMAEPQKRYGPYEIVKAIGKGKFAIVYRAKRLPDGEVVALKRINVDSIDDKARDKTLKEVGFLQSLDHPNVIRYMDRYAVCTRRRWVMWCGCLFCALQICTHSPCSMS